MIYTIIRSDSTTVTLDCVQQFGENHSATATQHPVETGSAITDHVFLNNTELSLKGVVSDFSPSPDYITMASLDGATVDTSIRNHTTEIKDLLMSIFRNRDVVTIQVSIDKLSDFSQFENCVLTSVGFSDDPESGEAIYPDLKFTQIRMVSKSTRQEKAVPTFLSQNTAQTKQVGAGNGSGTDAAGASATPAKTLADRYSPEAKKVILANRHETRVDRYVHNGANVEEARVQAAKDIGGSWDKENLKLVGGNINIDPDKPLIGTPLSNEQRTLVANQARLDKVTQNTIFKQLPTYISVSAK